MKKQNFCKCGNQITREAKMCRECYKKYQSKNSIGKLASNFKDGRTLKKYKCKICKEPISVKSGAYGSGMCLPCSRKEQFKNPENNPFFGKKHTEKAKLKMSLARKGIYIGKKCPAYINGESSNGYPSEFNDKLREKIRTRDNFECQCCGMTEEEHLIVRGTNLTIHHIDYNRKNNKEINLITTCLWCNIRANSNREYWKEFYQEKIKNILSEVKKNV